MRILHLALQSPYNEGWGYQENLITKYQVKLGHEVTLVTTVYQNNTQNQKELCDPQDYVSPDGFRVIRLKHRKFKPAVLSSLLKYYRIYDLLIELKPDFVMIHGLGDISSLQVYKYVKRVNSACIVIADNHLDEQNGGNGLVCKPIVGKLYQLFWKCVNAKMQRIYKKVYGVTPWRCDYARRFFGIRQDLLDVLPAGAADDKFDYAQKATIGKEVRRLHEISEDDFLVVTGGKIDAKKRIDRLMEAVTRLDIPNVKLLVFGQCNEDVREKVETLADHPNIRYIGWISSEETYRYFLAADLMFFPGLHSVMWEQACACGTPIVVADNYENYHVDVGGNCFILKHDDVESIYELLQYILTDETAYQKALEVARSDKRKQFLYSEIARKSLEMAE